MGIATDILGLREHHLSSVTELLAALERVRESPTDKISARAFLASDAADTVLTNIAAHAAEAMSLQPPNCNPRRLASAVRRKTRRFESGPLTRQRVLFA
jgi:hypothetical protein